MDDDELIKELPASDEKDIYKTLGEDEPITTKQKIIMGIVAGILLITIILFIALLSNSGSSRSKSRDEYGRIICKYYIQTTKSPTPIISKEFSQASDIEIFIKGNKIDFTTEYQFDSLGETEVNITFPEYIDMKNMFKDVIALRDVVLYSEKSCKITSMESTFENCRNLLNIKIIDFDTSEIKSLKKTFYGANLEDLKEFEITSRYVEDMSYMFANSELNNLVLNVNNLNNVKDISYMFSECKSLSSLNISDFKTSKVTSMSHLFNSCIRLNSIDLSSFDTSSVEDMSGMFKDCTSLEKLDLNFNTVQVKYVTEMFQNCITLSSLNLGNFDTKNIVSMSHIPLYFIFRMGSI